MEPVDLVLENIYQSRSYRKHLIWPRFNDEPRVQEKQQVKNQQSCIFVFVAYVAILSSNLGRQPRCEDSIPHILGHGRFTEIQSNFRRKKLHRTN